MAIQMMYDQAALIEVTRLAGVSLLSSAMALVEVWLGRLAYAIDWTSPNVGTSIACAAAVSAVRVVSAKLTRPRVNRLHIRP